MFEITRQLLMLSLVVALSLAVFLYYSNRTRISQLEQDMSSMFNLVSTLNDEQKRMGNLLIYNMNQSDRMIKQNNETTNELQTTIEVNKDANKLDKDENDFMNDDNTDKINDDENAANRLTEVSSPQVPENKQYGDDGDAGDDGDDNDENDGGDSVNYYKYESPTSTTDLRLVVSDNEDSDDEETGDKALNINDIILHNNNEKMTMLNKMKLPELKNIIDNLNVPKSEIAKAKKLKKTQLIEFIINNDTESNNHKELQVNVENNNDDQSESGLDNVLAPDNDDTDDD